MTNQCPNDETKAKFIRAQSSEPFSRLQYWNSRFPDWMELPKRDRRSGVDSVLRGATARLELRGIARNCAELM